MPIRQEIEAACPAGAAIGAELFELFAGRVHDDALTAVLGQANDVAVASTIGRDDAAAGNIVNCVYFLARTIYLQDEHIRGNESVAVGQTLSGDGRVRQALLGPAFLAGAINFKNSVAATVANEREIVPGSGLEAGEIYTTGVDFPPGRPGLAAFLSLGCFRAQRHVRSCIARQLIKSVLDLPGLLAR